MSVFQTEDFSAILNIRSKNLSERKTVMRFANPHIKQKRYQRRSAVCVRKDLVHWSNGYDTGLSLSW